MHHHDGWAVANAAGNIAIVCGYLVVPFTALPRLIPWHSACPKSVWFYRTVRTSGMLFFLLCAITHVSMVIGLPPKLMIINHVAQGGAVFCFVIGFDRMVKRIEQRAVSTYPTGPPPEVSP